MAALNKRGEAGVDIGRLRIKEDHVSTAQRPALGPTSNVGGTQATSDGIQALDCVISFNCSPGRANKQQNWDETGTRNKVVYWPVTKGGH